MKPLVGQVSLARSSAEPEASRWSLMLPRSKSRATRWNSFRDCWSPTGDRSGLRKAPGHLDRSAKRSWCSAGSANAAACTAWPATPHVSQATGYRYLHEGIDVLADQAPDLHEVLERCQRDGMTHAFLDGTLIASDRLAGVCENGNDLWFGQKHKAFGGNIQFLAAPDGTPLWISHVEPGSTPDITAARIHALPAALQGGGRGPAHPGRQGLPRCEHRHPHPGRRPKGKSERALHADTRTENMLIRDLRALGERTAAELKERWRALRHITLSPSRIGEIARAALVLNVHSK